jgi:hypothetical protein
MALQIAYPDPGGVGYHPVLYMVRLAGELFGVSPTTFPLGQPSTLTKLTALLPRGRGKDDCLLISPSPRHLAGLLELDGWRQRYRRIVAWVFDSFWPNEIPRFARVTRVFDEIFVTEQEDLDTWRRMMGVSVEWLPWGSDVLRLGSDNPTRRVDLQRVGRQPASWDDDAKTVAACQARGLVFAGRPSMFDDAAENQRALMNAFAQTKLTLSFSNSVSPASYTHPSREYVTARWTDALASGATVAGIPPRSPSVSELLWPEALLDIGSADRDEGLAAIERAVRAWSPASARRNLSMALQRLDWRWRFKRLQESLGVKAERLETELAALRDRIAGAGDARAVAP